MASKPTVMMTLAGDESKLTDAFDRVGDASKQMSDKVSSSSKGFEEASSAGENLAEKADGAEGKFIGFTDSLSGLQGAFEGIADPSLSFGERLGMLGQAGADLAGGLASFVIPAISSMWQKLMGTTAATWALTAAQTAWNGITAAGAVVMRLLNAAFISSPIGWLVLAIGGLVTAFVILWNKSAAFRDFFTGMWNGIKGVVSAVVQWIKDVWNGIPAFFKGIVDTIGKVFSGIGNAIKNAFKAAINFVIDIINGAIWALNKVIDGINYVPGVEISHIPKIPRLHSGGTVPGLPGQEVLMMLQGGEHVSTSSQGGGGTTVTFAGDTDGAFATAFMNLVRSGVITVGA